MTTSQWRIAAVSGAALLIAATFLPVFEGPSIESWLGKRPNWNLNYIHTAVGPQSWLSTGRGEQFVFLLSALACLGLAALGRFRALRFAAPLTLGLLILGCILTAGRMRRVVHLMWLQRSVAGEFGEMGASLPPIVRWTPQWGLLVFVLGAALLGLAASHLVRHQEDESAALPLRRPTLATLGATVLALLGLGFWQFRSTQAPTPRTARIPGMPFPPGGFPPGFPPGRFPPGMAPQTPQINGPETVKMPKPVYRGQFERVLFSPDGEFLAARYGEEWLIYALKSGQLKPLQRIPTRSETIDTSDAYWQSPRVLRFNSSLALVFNPQQRKWVPNTNSNYSYRYPYLRDEDVAQVPGEQISRGSEVFVPESSAVVWDMFNSSPPPTGSGSIHNGLIAITSVPNGQIFNLPEELRLTQETRDITLAPRRPGGRLLAAVHQSELLSGGSGDTMHLRIYDVTAGRKLWEKKLLDDSAEFAFSPDGRFLVGAGTPRALPRETNVRTIINGREVPASQLPTSYGDNGLDIWEATSGRVKTRLNEKGIVPASLTLNRPKNAVLYFKSGGANEKDRLVARALPSGKLLAREEWEKSGNLPRLAVSPDGEGVAVIETDRIHLFSWKTLQAGTGKPRALVP